MRRLRSVVLVAVVAVVVSLLAGAVTATPAQAGTPARAYLLVTHTASSPASNVAVTDGYTVRYRYSNQYGNWSSWITSPTGNGVSDATCANGTYRWKYQTALLDPDLYPQVEWEVTMGYGRAGTRCGGGSVTYHDSDPINKLTYPGGTAMLNAGAYW